MCRPASFVVTKSRVLWSREIDSHEDIIKENKLNDRGVCPDFVRVEIVPPNDNYSMPLDKWRFCVDQDVTPEWWDPMEGEVSVRDELPKWAEVHIIRSGKHRQEGGLRIYLGSSQCEVSGGIAWFYDSSGGEVSGGEALFYDSSRGEVSGGIARFLGSSQGEVRGGEAWFLGSSQGEVSGGEAWFYDSSRGEVSGGRARFLGSSQGEVRGGEAWFNNSYNRK